MRTHSLASLALIAIAGVCSCAPSADTVGGVPHIVPTPMSGDALREDEIAKANVLTAYDAVARLRPAMLQRNRTVTSYDRREVYLDGLPVGGLEQLVGIPAAHIREIHFVSAIQATGRYGRVPTEGIILVTTKLGPR